MVSLGGQEKEWPRDRERKEVCWRLFVLVIVESRSGSFVVRPENRQRLSQGLTDTHNVTQHDDRRF